MPKMIKITTADEFISEATNLLRAAGFEVYVGRDGGSTNLSSNALLGEVQCHVDSYLTDENSTVRRISKSIRDWLLPIINSGAQVTFGFDVIDQVRYNGINVDLIVKVDGNQLDLPDDVVDDLSDFIGDNFCGSNAPYMWKLFLPLIVCPYDDEYIAACQQDNVKFSFLQKGDDQLKKRVFKDRLSYVSFVMNASNEMYTYFIAEGTDS